MANVLGVLFKDIADAIREKTGKSGNMRPLDFPQEISDIVVMDGDTESILDEIDFALDDVNGEVVGEVLYHVTFIGASGEELCQIPVYEGYDCPDPIATGVITTPAKESERLYSYTFAGWSFSEEGTADPTVFDVVESDRTLYAVFSQEPIYLSRGTCGDGVYWTVNPDYLLRIWGAGRMDDYDAVSYDVGWLTYDETTAPWSSQYRDKITTIIVEKDVVKIGKAAFAGLTAVTSVTLEEGAGADVIMGTIPMNCFNNCKSLKTIHIPSSIDYLAGFAFRASGLEHITIPDSMKFIYSDAFSMCENLTSVEFENVVWYYQDTDIQISTSILSDHAAAAEFLLNPPGDFVKYGSISIYQKSD